jgi:hypothetical protein
MECILRNEQFLQKSLYLLSGSHFHQIIFYFNPDLWFCLDTEEKDVNLCINQWFKLFQNIYLQTTYHNHLFRKSLPQSHHWIFLRNLLWKAQFQEDMYHFFFPWVLKDLPQEKEGLLKTICCNLLDLLSSARRTNLVLCFQCRLWLDMDISL